MNLKLVFFFLFVFSCCKGFCQAADSLLVETSKEDGAEKGFPTYSVSIKNLSQTPVCILHSTYINLFYDPPQGLAVRESKGSTEIYSLEYTMRDTVNVYEGPINNFNGEIILPLQEIKFRIMVANSNLSKKLAFEYFPVKRFCYPDFKNEIFKDATQWHKKYKRLQRVVQLQ